MVSGISSSRSAATSTMTSGGCAMVRDLIGTDVALSVDANQSWDVNEAIDAIRRLAPFDLHWVEEPTSPDDVLGHITITNEVSPGPDCHRRARRQPRDLQAASGSRGDLRLPDRCLPRGGREREHRGAAAGSQVRRPDLPARRRRRAVRAGPASRDVRLRGGRRESARAAGSSMSTISTSTSQSRSGCRRALFGSESHPVPVRSFERRRSHVPVLGRPASADLDAGSKGPAWDSRGCVPRRDVS